MNKRILLFGAALNGILMVLNLALKNTQQADAHMSTALTLLWIGIAVK